jgi:hypothetical protein
VTTRKEKEDWVMKCGKEKGKGRLGAPSLPFPFSLPHFITKSSFSFLFATLHHPVFLFLSGCHTLSATRKEKEDWVMKCGKEKRKRRLGDEVWQRERKWKTG